MADNETWFYVNQGQSAGPLSSSQIDALAQSGAIKGDTLVWPGSGEWVPAQTTRLAQLFGPNAVQPTSIPAPSVASRNPPAALKNPTVRVLVYIFVAVAGLSAVAGGIAQIREGMSEWRAADRGEANASTNPNAQIVVQGCQGVAADAVQCAYQNTGTVEAKLCMDVVATCDDGRHVASACSDAIPVGQSSMKLINNFSPAIAATNSCNGSIQYENVKIR